MQSLFSMTSGLTKTSLATFCGPVTFQLACEQALIFVVIKDVAQAAKPRVTSRRAQRAGESATSFITTKMRACSQATFQLVDMIYELTI